MARDIFSSKIVALNSLVSSIFRNTLSIDKMNGMDENMKILNSGKELLEMHYQYLHLVDSDEDTNDDDEKSNEGKKEDEDKHDSTSEKEEEEDEDKHDSTRMVFLSFVAAPVPHLTAKRDEMNTTQIYKMKFLGKSAEQEKKVKREEVDDEDTNDDDEKSNEGKKEDEDKHDSTSEKEEEEDEDKHDSTSEKEEEEDEDKHDSTDRDKEEEEDEDDMKECLLCGFQPKTKYAMKKHIKNHRDADKFRCTQCVLFTKVFRKTNVFPIVTFWYC
ncbi:myb-like protein X [Frankliniella occidentalis]|uniref:Myb-like protein X n=1 Tax=Frankliniella occidentalis TaxID=133901 RepID=A0A9C6X082_FRAOC|nr:myb-like protein X [Frankliniella occidentalis]